MADASEAAPRGLDPFEEDFDRQVRIDSDAAAKAQLARGRSITYRNPDTPDGHVIREHPDGRIELVRIDTTGRRVADRAR